MGSGSSATRSPFVLLEEAARSVVDGDDWDLEDLIKELRERLEAEMREAARLT
jgi:hypothetical protein